MTLNDTPRGMRLHIGIFGKRNTGKSTMMNALTNQPIALVSDIAGTTTDPVYKSMEIKGIGPVVFIDTAGFDDVGTLGEKRVSMTEDTIKKTDIALFLFTDVPDIEKEWIEKVYSYTFIVIGGLFWITALLKMINNLKTDDNFSFMSPSD